MCEKHKQQTLPLRQPKAQVVFPVCTIAVLTGQFDSYFIPTVSNGSSIQPGGGASRQCFFLTTAASVRPCGGSSPQQEWQALKPTFCGGQTMLLQLLIINP